MADEHSVLSDAGFSGFMEEEHLVLPEPGFAGFIAALQEGG